MPTNLDIKEPQSAFKKNLIAGLLIIIPAGLTLFLFTLVVSILDNALDPFIISVLKSFGFTPPSNFQVPGLGLVLVLTGVFLAGLFVKNFFGKKIVEFWHQAVEHVPFVRVVYLTIKKIVDAMTLANTPFQQVVLVDYPRTGLKSIGIVSGSAKEEVLVKLKGEQVCVFVPTTPNPTTGFTVMIPREKLIPLDIPVDQGLKMIVSVGMYNPRKGD
tara:strand:+ start:158 stop:802 length:645 start_codon:yes stop_codon:yes gene_type:complete